MSALITEALENLLAIRDGLRTVREWERENGEFTPGERAEADAILGEHGVGRDQ